VVVAPQVTPTPVNTNTESETAWTRHRLSFQKARLVDVVEEFNRYNTKPLQLDDRRLENFLVSGTFSSTDPAALLRFLREQPGVRIVETPSLIRISAD
jgi:transmembrane sensor